MSSLNIFQPISPEIQQAYGQTTVTSSLNILLGWKMEPPSLPPSSTRIVQYFRILIFSSVHEIMKLKRAWYDRERGSDLRYRAEGAVAGGGGEAFPRQDWAHRRLASTRHQDLRRIISLPPRRGESNILSAVNWTLFNGFCYSHFVLKRCSVSVTVETDPDPCIRTAVFADPDPDPGLLFRGFQKY